MFEYIKHKTSRIKALITRRSIYFIISIIVIIGIILFSIIPLFNDMKRSFQPSDFQTYETTAPVERGETAGAYTQAPTATESATITPRYIQKFQKVTNTPYPTNTQGIQKQQSNNPTATPAPQSSNTSNSTAQPNPTATSTPKPPMPTNTPPPQPTNTQPPQQEPTPTPTPSFSANLSTSVNDNNINASLNANKPLKICIFYFLGENDIPKSTKHPSPSGTTCSADNGADGVIKIRAYAASTDGSTTNTEKSAPF